MGHLCIVDTFLVTKQCDIHISMSAFLLKFSNILFEDIVEIIDQCDLFLAMYWVTLAILLVC